MRTDLRTLTAQDVAALSSPGLVSRAQRDLEEGMRPVLEERADGTVRGTFSDGTVAEVGVGAALRQSACSCRATALCRHRVAVVLAYREAHGPISDAAWSPADFTEADLLGFCGKRLLERARRVSDKGGSVEVQRQPPLVRLPTCAVRFLVPRDLGYALCDCAARAACEHVALAVWAFQRAASGAETARLDLRRGESVVDTDAMRAAVELAREVLRDGASSCGSAMMQRFAVVGGALRQAGFCWPATLLDDLQTALDDFHGRHARYAPATITALITELLARARAGRGTGELSAAFVLGADTPMETVLDRVRLVGLGARLEAVEDGLRADVYLADPETANVVVLRKALQAANGWEARDREMGSDVRLQAVAGGQLLSEGIKRRANRIVTLPVRRGRARSSLAPLFSAWETLPAPIRIDDLDAHFARRQLQPPAMLAPRVLAENVHVIAVRGVDEVVFASGAQELRATLQVAPGVPLRLSRRWHRATPGALPALADALGRGVRWISGFLAAGELEPLALMLGGDEVVVPDLAPGGDIPHVARGHGAVPTSPVWHAIRRARTLLDEGAHGGLDHVGVRWIDGVRVAAEGAREVGLDRLANLLGTVAQRVQARLGAATSEVDAAVEAWEEASLRCLLLEGACR